jgi:hypothetical protein
VQATQPLFVFFACFFFCIPRGRRRRRAWGDVPLVSLRSDFSRNRTKQACDRTMDQLHPVFSRAAYQRLRRKLLGIVDVDVLGNAGHRPREMSGSRFGILTMRLGT